jgi:hypothetical protein
VLGNLWSDIMRDCVRESVGADALGDQQDVCVTSLQKAAPDCTDLHTL